MATLNVSTVRQWGNTSNKKLWWRRRSYCVSLIINRPCMQEIMTKYHRRLPAGPHSTLITSPNTDIMKTSTFPGDGGVGVGTKLISKLSKLASSRWGCKVNVWSQLEFAAVYLPLDVDSRYANCVVALQGGVNLVLHKSSPWLLRPFDTVDHNNAQWSQ